VEAAHVEHAEVAVRTDFDAGQLRDQLDGDILLPVVLVATVPEYTILVHHRSERSG
jgi:hypothetical protein